MSENFVSYRRDGGADLARLIRLKLEERGYNVFLDVDDLRSGPFNTALFKRIDSSTDVVVILSANCLERCGKEDDWMRQEVARALRAGVNFIPVTTESFQWPEERLPDDIRDLPFLQSAIYSHHFPDASIDRLVSMLKSHPSGPVGRIWRLVRQHDRHQWLQEKTRSERQRKVATVNRELACISKIFSLAIRDGKTDTNPCRQVQKYEENNERNRYLLPEEEERLLGELSGSRAHLEPIIRVAINTGMRRGEILAMRWSWIDFVRGFIHIPSEATKTAKPRSIPMNQVVRDLLMDLRGTRGRSEAVFTSPKTGGLLTDINHGFVHACDDAEIVDFRFHDLRHTAATRLADAGADPFVIAEILGHSDLRMTKRYTHATDQRKRQALEQLVKYSKKAEKSGASRPICHKIVTIKERKVG